MLHSKTLMIYDAQNFTKTQHLVPLLSYILSVQTGRVGLEVATVSLYGTASVEVMK